MLRLYVASRHTYHVKLVPSIHILNGSCHHRSSQAHAFDTDSQIFRNSQTDLTLKSVPKVAVNLSQDSTEFLMTILHVFHSSNTLPRSAGWPYVSR
jgi:hypothetical protein